MKPRPVRWFVARLLVALAAGAAMTLFARFEADPAAGAESLYLAFLATSVLLATAALAVPPAGELAVGAGLATACVWALPPGPGRGAAMGLLLVSTFAVAAARRLAREARADGGLPLAATVPLALGAQLLLRGDLLLAPALDLHTLAVFFGLPVAAAVALAYLAGRHGTARALVAAAAVLVLAPGWNVATTLALVALAAGSFLAAHGAASRWSWLAVPLLLAPFAFEPRSGWGAAVAGLALAFPRLALGLAAGGGLAAILLGAPPAGISGAIGIALLVPALVAAERQRLWALATALVLAVAVPWIPDRSVLAAPVVLVALGLKPAGLAVSAQRFWSAALLAGVMLAAGYPWLRRDPLVQVLIWVGLADVATVGWIPLAVAAGLAALALLPLFGRPAVGERALPYFSPRSPAFGAVVTALLVGGGLFAHRPAPLTQLLPAATAVRLTVARPRWEGQFPPAGRASGTVVVESSLANGAALPRGTPVAVLIGADGERHPLRAGIETGEWAARRPDVAARSASPPPEGWISWVVGTFFAQRYRARFELRGCEKIAPSAGAAAGGAQELASGSDTCAPSSLAAASPAIFSPAPAPDSRGSFAIERAPTLPPEVEVALHAVGAER